MVASVTALGRTGVPDDIGPVIVFPLSNDHRWWARCYMCQLLEHPVKAIQSLGGFGATKGRSPTREKASSHKRSGDHASSAAFTRSGRKG